MHRSQRFLTGIITAIFFLSLGSGYASAARDMPPVTEKVETLLAELGPRLEKELGGRGLHLGSPVFIRIFKLPAELEVWIDTNGRYELFKTYPICNFSGYPGPKLHEGDWQSPEGFYTVSADSMHPRSSYHLAFNIGYPNDYDSLLDRDGSNIMVHGNCSSMGCFAMSDYRMEEIYVLVHSALAGGQHTVPLHVFPFRMTGENMRKFRSSPWIGFWQNLREGYDAFEQTGRVPEIRVADGKYVISGPVKMALRMTGRPQAIPAPGAPQNHRYK